MALIKPLPGKSLRQPGPDKRLVAGEIKSGSGTRGTELSDVLGFELMALSLILQSAGSTSRYR